MAVLSSDQAHHLRCLNDFVDAQAAYYAQCYQYMVNLQKQLGRLAHFYNYAFVCTSYAFFHTKSCFILNASTMDSSVLSNSQIAM